MSDPITPKANRRIIDGEVLNTTATKSLGTTLQKPKKEASGKWQKIKQGLVFILLIILVLIILFLLNNQKNIDWQVENINQLQTQTSMLLEDKEHLKLSQSDLEKRLTEQENNQEAMQDELILLVDSPHNQPVISQADLDAIRFKLGVLESELSTLAETYSEQLESFSKELKLSLEQGLAGASSLVAPELRQDLENKITAMGSKISDLFDFKNQLSESLDKPTDKLVPEIIEIAPPEKTYLSSMRIQQWILEINGQWLIAGNIAQTKQQLLALDKAIGLSNFAEKMTLVRYLGEDFNRLEQAHQNNTAAKLEQKLAGLQDWVLGLDIKGQSAIEHITTNETLEAVNLTAWERLQSALTGLFSIQKRATPESLTLFEQELLAGVIQQRMLLLFDKANWAVKIKSADDLKHASTMIKAMVTEYYVLSTEQKQQLQVKLSTLDVEFPNVRQPLKIVSAL